MACIDGTVGRFTNSKPSALFLLEEFGIILLTRDTPASGSHLHHDLYDAHCCILSVCIHSKFTS